MQSAGFSQAKPESAGTEARGAEGEGSGVSYVLKTKHPLSHSPSLSRSSSCRSRTILGKEKGKEEKNSVLFFCFGKKAGDDESTQGWGGLLKPVVSQALGGFISSAACL